MRASPRWKHHSCVMPVQRWRPGRSHGAGHEIPETFWQDEEPVDHCRHVDPDPQHNEPDDENVEDEPDVRERRPA
jgi:hypothetical protein